MRVPRRRRRLAAAVWARPSATQIEVFFASHSALTERARALIAAGDRQVIVPWGRTNRQSQIL